MKSILKIALVLLTVLSPMNGFSQDLKTKINVTKGQEFNIQTDIKMDITQSLGGQETKAGSENSVTAKYQITNLFSNGNLELTSTNWDVKSRTKAPNVDTTLTIPGKVGPTLKMEINKYGKIVAKTITDSSDISEVNLGNNLVSTGVFCEFPEKDVIKVGEKWVIAKSDTVSQMASKIGVNFSNEYTLGALEQLDGKKLQKITLATTIDLGGKASQMGMEIFIEGKGAGTGNIYIDPVSKVIYSSNTAVELNMDLALKGPQNMTIPMSQKITVSQKLK